jgi:hypothetical protein
MDDESSKNLGIVTGINAFEWPMMRLTGHIKTAKYN